MIHSVGYFCTQVFENGDQAALWLDPEFPAMRGLPRSEQ